MINTSKPTTSITNASKVSIGETWATVTTTWATETRTWLGISQLITNATMSSTDPLWSYRTFPWQLSSPWTMSSNGMTNQSKP